MSGERTTPPHAARRCKLRTTCYNLDDDRDNRDRLGSRRCWLRARAPAPAAATYGHVHAGLAHAQILDKTIILYLYGRGHGHGRRSRHVYMIVPFIGSNSC